MWDRFPPRMRKAIVTALEEAGRHGADAANAQHLLAAIAADSACAAAFMFERSGIAPAKLLERLNSNSSNALPQRAPRFASDAMHVLDVAVSEADRLRDRHVGTEHVALALTLTNYTPAAALLKEQGFSTARGLAALKTWHKQGQPRQRSRFTQWPFIGKLLRGPIMAYNVFVRKSLGHPRFATNPYPLYRKLRETEPVRKDPIAPVWVITSYAETMTMMRDPRFKKDPFASERLPPIIREQLKVSDAAAGRASLEMVSMLFLDPPEHTRVRGIFTKAFTPRRLEALRPRIKLITDKLLDRALSPRLSPSPQYSGERAGERGERLASDRNRKLASNQPLSPALSPEYRGEGVRSFDLIRDLAYPLPVTVIAELLGFPPEDYEKIKRWSDEMAEALSLNPSTEAQARAYRARQEIREYFETIVAQLKQTPGDNLLSALISGEAYGERGDRLASDELFSNAILLLAAGHETTTNLIGNGVLALLKNPEQLKLLRDKPELIDSCVEELLRFDPPVQWTSRVAGEDIEMRGKTIERGAIVLASLGAANRDPAVFDRPDEFDIQRKENRHISFGTGAHFCLGAALARMEASIAIGTLVARYPNLKLGSNKLRWRKGLTFRGVLELWLSV